MKYRPTKTSKKGIRLRVYKSDFDDIKNRKKDKLYRAVTDDMVTLYIKSKFVDNVLYLSYNGKMISEEYFNLYGISLYNNNDKFLFVPKDIKYLVLIDSKFIFSDKLSFDDKITVEVTDISFELLKHEDGSDVRLSYSMEEGNLKIDENGELVMWYIIYHLGDIVSNDLQLDFEYEHNFDDNTPF